LDETILSPQERVMRIVSIFLLILMSSPALSEETWQLPPKEVVDIIDAKPEPVVGFSPDSKWMLFLDLDAMPDISDIARRRLRLAGLRIDPQANAKFQTSWYRGISIRKTNGDSTDRGTAIELEADAKISSTRWCHDSKKFLFTQVTENGTALYVCFLETGETRKLHDNICTVMQAPQWMPDGEHVALLTVPETRGAEPAQPTAPAGPSIQESSGNTSPTRTYQDLLKTPYDESLFEHYITSEAMIIDLDGKVVHRFPKPDAFIGLNPSPDGKLLMVQRLNKPFSYLLTYQCRSSVSRSSFNVGCSLRRRADTRRQNGTSLGRFGFLCEPRSDFSYRIRSRSTLGQNPAA
jgi:hypothetical protein